MSDDPIKDLEDSNQQGPTGNPPPPSEVRRLGTRIRRRNAAFAVVGAAAVIAAVVTPLAVLASGSDDTEPPVTKQSVSPSVSPSVTPSQSPSSPPATAIPDDLPIAAPPSAVGSDIPAGFPIEVDIPDLSGDGGEITGPGAAEDGLGSVTLCGTDIWPVPPNDRLAVTSTGPEYRQSREVVTFLDAEAAVNVMTRLRQQVRACPSQSGATAGDGSPTNRLYRIHGADTGYESLTFSSTLEDGSLGGAIYQFVRVGYGVLAMYVGGEWSPDTVGAGVAELTETSAKVTPAMCVFTKAGC